MKAHLVEHHADIFAKRGTVYIDIFSEDLDFSAVSFDNIQNQFNCSRLSGAVLPDKSADRAFRNIEAYMIQFKIAVIFYDIFQFNYILHILSPLLHLLLVEKRHHLLQFLDAYFPKDCLIQRLVQVFFNCSHHILFHKIRIDALYKAAFTGN